MADERRRGNAVTAKAARHPALWGDAAHAVGPEEREALMSRLRGAFPGAAFTWRDAVEWQEVPLPAPRVTPPPALSSFVSTAPYDRLLHATGRSFTDLARARAGNYGTLPDAVAVPRSAADVSAVLEWCDGSGAACIPFGGGTSVVGGVTPPGADRPVVTLQLRAMDRVLDVDAVSRAACIQAGATGPVLEDQLRAQGLTLRFYPQSFEFSTLGGWIATRAGGHFATGPTHIDDLVEAVEAVTPRGTWSSARLPASGAGPSPDRMLLGSEGVLGVVTQAWVRVQPRPEHRAGATVQFSTFADGAVAVRHLAQSGLAPAACRLLDPLEAALGGAGDGTCAVLVLGFESPWRPVGDDLALALTLCRDTGGVTRTDGADRPAGQWRRSFLRAPYLRDALLGFGMVVETFETATTWDRFDVLHRDVLAATQAAVDEVCGGGVVTCRTTHAYPDGVAPYFTVVAPGRRGAAVSQWQEIKAAAAGAVLAAGGTVTHHHAVGRDHRPWYDQQRPEVFSLALRAAKRAVDPAGVLNPGVLLD